MVDLFLFLGPLRPILYRNLNLRPTQSIRTCFNLTSRALPGRLGLTPQHLYGESDMWAEVRQGVAVWVTTRVVSAWE